MSAQRKYVFFFTLWFSVNSFCFQYSSTNILCVFLFSSQRLNWAVSHSINSMKNELKSNDFDFHEEYEYYFEPSWFFSRNFVKKIYLHFSPPYIRFFSPKFLRFHHKLSSKRQNWDGQSISKLSGSLSGMNLKMFMWDFDWFWWIWAHFVSNKNYHFFVMKMVA